MPTSTASKTGPRPVDDTAPPDEARISPHQLRVMHALLAAHGMTGDAAKHSYLSATFDRIIDSTADLTTAEGATVIHELETADTVEARTPRGIVGALIKVMAEVGAVGKDSTNTQQHFNFRGVDAVVNATSPAFRKHGIVVTPTLNSVDYQPMQLSGGKVATSCRVVVTYTFTYKDGSNLSASVAAEAFDMGDKATPKAMSVAFRTALLQALTLPTDETDPDAETYEQAAQSPTQAFNPSTQDCLAEIDRVAAERGTTREAITADWRAANGGLTVADLTIQPATVLIPLVQTIRATP